MELIPYEPPSGSRKLPDEGHYTNRFQIKSETRNSLYLIARNIYTGLWECSCMGWKRWRSCKHLTTLRLPTLPKLVGGGLTIHASASSRKQDFTGGYKTYDPAKEGYGSAKDWSAAYNFRMGIAEARRAVGADTPRGILGVLASATFEEIKAAWRKLVRQHHPDVGGDPAMFRKIQGAWEILEDMYSK